jgi:hypothetical protein
MNSYTFSLKLFRQNYERILKSGLLLKMSSLSQNDEAKMETLKFDNLALRSLPIDANTLNHTREVRGACFSKVIRKKTYFEKKSFKIVFVSDCVFMLR